MGKRITIAESKQINELYNSGLTCVQIAKGFNCSAYTISKHVKTPRPRGVRPLSNDETKEMNELYNSGMTYKKVAEATHHGFSTVALYIEEPRPKGRIKRTALESSQVNVQNNYTTGR